MPTLREAAPRLAPFTLHPPPHHPTTSLPSTLHPSANTSPTPTLREAAPRLHHLPRLKLQWPISIGGREKIGPFKDFGEAELVQGNDDGADGLLGADDENFDGLSTANFYDSSAFCTRNPWQLATGRTAIG